MFRSFISVSVYYLSVIDYVEEIVYYNDIRSLHGCGSNEVIFMKKALSLLIALAVILSAVCTVPIISASTASVTGVETGSANTISFDANATGWRNYDYIAFHIWAIDDNSFSGYDWGGKRQRGKDDDGDYVWTYDLDAAGLTIQPGCQYCVIFYSSTGAQTYNLLFGSECLGHTAYCDGTTYENPEDSNKTAQAAFWSGGIDSSVYGPELKISSIGTVVGTCCPSNTTPYKMFVEFLINTLSNARQFSGKDDQTLIDDICKGLGIGKVDCKKAIAETGVSVAWDESKSSLAGDESEPGIGDGGGSSGDSEYTRNYSPYRVRISDVTPYDQFCHYLLDGAFAEDLRIYGNRTEQQIVDTAASKYGLYRDDVALALIETNANGVEWRASKSSLPTGKSCLTYVKDTLYLIGTRNGVDRGIENVDKNAILEYHENTGYYIISNFNMSTGDTAQIARYDGNRRFTVVSKSVLKTAKNTDYLFFYRPESAGYSFGYNFGSEYYHNDGSGSSSGGSGSGGTTGEVFVWVKSTEDVTSGVKLTWDKVSGVPKYRVFVDNNGSWKGIGDTTTTSFIDKTAVPGRVYRYTVRGVGSDGKYCTSYVKEGWYHRYMNAPAITGVENTAEGALIKWNAVEGNARYRVYIRNGLNWVILGDTYGTQLLHPVKPIQQITVNEVSYLREDEGYYYEEPTSAPVRTDDGSQLYAEDGMTYRYLVRCVSYDGMCEIGAYDETGVRSTFSGKSPVLLAQPKIVSANDTREGMEVKWNSVPGAVRYRVFCHSGNGWYRLGEATEAHYLDSSINSVRKVYTVNHDPNIQEEPMEPYLDVYKRTYMVVCISEDGSRYVSPCSSGFFAEYRDYVEEIYPDTIRGDYDGDGAITIMDATRAQNVVAELVTMNEEYLAKVDADGDGVLTIMDATRIQNVLAELMYMDGTRRD